MDIGIFVLNKFKMFIVILCEWYCWWYFKKNILKYGYYNLWEKLRLKDIIDYRCNFDL